VRWHFVGVREKQTFTRVERMALSSPLSHKKMRPKWPHAALLTAFKSSAVTLGLGLAACGEAQDFGDFDTQSHESELTQLRIEAENFQRFFDSDTAHSGNCGTGPVDAEVTTDPKGGQCSIGWTTAGEWLEYDLSIVEQGNHTFTFRVASAQTNRTMHLEVDGVNVTGSITAPSSGWQSYVDRTVANIPLTAGQHVLRVVFDTGAVNFNYFELTQTSVTAQTIVQDDFASNMNAFNYSDQNALNYADGFQEAGRLKMTLGGIDNTLVNDIRGRFHRMLWVSESKEITLKFDYVLEQSCAYETDEVSEIRATMDGIPLTGATPYVSRVVGNGNSCPGVTARGTYTKKFTLSPGKHHLEIDGFNSKKDASDEFTTVWIDNVVITAAGALCAPSISPTMTKLCNACDGLLNCQGNCTVNVPSNVGASCGSCGGVVRCDGTCSEPLNAPCGAPPTVAERHAACARDPRVVAGLVSQDVCTGADVFFRETFNGNGRTCSSCHPVANNYTIDPPFVQALHATNPNDPLFVAKAGTPLERLETSDLLDDALILENVDGFQNPENVFVSRSVNHLFSLAITMEPDPADGSTTPPVHRVGWGGDGAPDDGSLRSFLDGAIKQHFTKRLVRTPGVDFRLPNDFERDVVESFQLTLGRQNELDLAAVRFADANEEIGRTNFLDPQKARCGVCHANAGANYVKSGKNRNFNNGSTNNSATLGRDPSRNLEALGDRGFGLGFNATGFTLPGYGDGNFSVPSLVEAADTGPWFHSNGSMGTSFNDAMQVVVARTYANDVNVFRESSGAKFLETIPEFGPTNITTETTAGVIQMVVVLNVVFNIDLARQRLAAAATLAADLRQVRADVQAKLMLLAGEEVEDAIRVMTTNNVGHEAERASLQSILNQVRQADANASWSTRRSQILSAIAALDAVRPRFGSNFNYQLGVGTLMY
jgi:Carbohydrate binding module (family 6)